MVSEVITRTFGLQPIDYCPNCKTAIVETKISDFKKKNFCCNCSLKIIKRPSSFPPEVFQKFKQAVNGLIKYGYNQPTAYFLEDGSRAVKTFYNLLNQKKHVKNHLRKIGLPERL
ncbi:MAG: hypothetical protein ACTSYA_12240, partial [Candidatus Kariarchaeaceae archaeon]